MGNVLAQDVSAGLREAQKAVTHKMGFEPFLVTCFIGKGHRLLRFEYKWILK